MGETILSRPVGWRRSVALTLPLPYTHAGARTSDWRKWPLSPQQATYAARDVCVCVDIFWKGPPALRVPSLPPSRPAVAPTTQPPAKVQVNSRTHVPQKLNA